jgi:hypothetical protein
VAEQSPPPEATLRSHRIAGLGAEQQLQQPLVCSRSKKILMKSLGVVRDDARITSEHLDKYVTAFHTPLSAVQVKALAALFGWSLPKEQSEDGLGPAIQGS